MENNSLIHKGAITALAQDMIGEKNDLSYFDLARFNLLSNGSDGSIIPP